MSTPPDFGGTEIEEGLEEDFGVQPEQHGRSDLAAMEEEPHDDNEAQAPDQTCARCGLKIEPGQDARRRADGHWVHEVCPSSII